jgi:elongation factor 2
MQLNSDHMGGFMENKHNIRIMSVIDAGDQVNASLVDALVCNAGQISAKIARNVDGRHDRYNTSMYFEYKVDAGEVAKKDGDEAKAENDGFTKVRVSKDSFLINLIDFPYRGDHPTDATATLHMTDGALFVVDCVDGVVGQTEALLREAMSERVRPCLMVNNVDRALFELQHSGEEIYQNMSIAIENVNVIIESCKFQDRDWQVVPCRGNVAFGSSLHQWGFTLQTFAKVYASKFSIPEEKMAEKLWGDWVFATNDGKNRWINSNSVNTNRGVDRDSGAKRAFVAFIMDPIIGMFQAVMNNELDEKGVPKVFDMAQAVGVSLSEDIIKATTKDALLTFIMQKWLPVAEAVLEIIVVHLPSPATAQEYRCETLYDGPLGDQAAAAIRACDSSEGALLVMYVSKMTTGADNRFIAFGRVFSGKIGIGQKVRVLGPEYTPGKKTDLLEMTVHHFVPMIGGYVTRVPAGNVCGVIGLEKYIPQFNITDSEAVCGMKVPAVAGLVRATVSVADAAESHQLSEAICALDRSDPVVRLETTDAGEHVIAAPSDLHLAMYLSTLQRSVKGILVATPVLALSKGGASSSAPHAILSETAMPALNPPETGLAEAAAETMEQRYVRTLHSR